MGKDQKIPYVKEAVWYFVKVAALFIILDYILRFTGYENQVLIIIFVVFAALSFRLLYWAMLISGYIIFYFASLLIENEFAILFMSLAATLFDTFILILYLKWVYDLKEEV